jgi:hypothetical protein
MQDHQLDQFEWPLDAVAYGTVLQHHCHSLTLGARSAVPRGQTPAVLTSSSSGDSA